MVGGSGQEGKLQWNERQRTVLFGWSRDDTKVTAYFKSATELGQPYAANELANCYYEGAGVEKNLTTARELFRKAAADKTNADGDDNLGVMMILGERGAKEVGNGVVLVEKAAKAGNKFAVAHLVEIGKALEPVVKKWKKTGVDKLGKA